MEKFCLLICLGLMVLASSCTKEEGLPLTGTAGSEAEGSEVELTIGVVPDQTRADAPSFEDKVETLQTFVFSDGALEAVGYSDSGDVTLRIHEGEKYIMVIANHPEIDWDVDLVPNDLTGLVVEMTEDGNWNVMVGSTFVMVSGESGSEIEAEDDFSEDGSSSDDDSASGDDSFSKDGSLWPVGRNTIMMTVHRIAARVVLRSVTNSLEDSDDDVIVHRAYITNVVGDADLTAVSSNYSYVPEVWYNKMKNTGDLPDILSTEEMDVSVVKDSAIRFNECFYCYPNPTATDTRRIYKWGWLSRFTRLVVEAVCGGNLWYYVVTLDGVQSNHSYEVWLEITGDGEIDPEEKMGFVDVGTDDGEEGDEEGEGVVGTSVSRPSAIMENRGARVPFKGGHAEICVL